MYMYMIVSLILKQYVKHYEYEMLFSFFHTLFVIVYLRTCSLFNFSLILNPVIDDQTFFNTPLFVSIRHCRVKILKIM